MRERFAIQRGSTVASMVLAALCVTAGPAMATGFFINQQSVRGLGRVDAGAVVAADELGTIFFNPAGLTRVVHDEHGPRRRLAGGVHLIVPRGTQRDRGSVVTSPGTLGFAVPIGGGDARNVTDPTPVPNVYLALPLGSGRSVVGVGVNAPFGLKATFDPGWHGRYDAIEASLETVNVSVVAAHRFESGFSVGGGLDVQRATSVLATAIPNPLAPGGPSPATDGRITTTGTAVTPGFNAGVLYEIDAETRIGAHYRSQMTHELSGSSVVEELSGPLAVFNGAVDARAALHLPAVAGIGLRAALGDELIALLGFTWFDWSTFREVRIQFADGRPDAVRPTRYRDAYALAAGAEHPVGSGWVARGGIRFDTTPTVDEFRDTTVPDSNRLWLGLGASYLRSPRWGIDVAFNHVFFRETAIAVTRTFFDDTPLATAARIHNDVRTVVNTIAADVRFRF